MPLSLYEGLDKGSLCAAFAGLFCSGDLYVISSRQIVSQSECKIEGTR